MTKRCHMLRSPTSQEIAHCHVSVLLVSPCAPKEFPSIQPSLDGVCIKEEGPQIRGFRCVPLAALPRRAQGRTGDDGQAAELPQHISSPFRVI